MRLAMMLLFPFVLHFTIPTPAQAKAVPQIGSAESKGVGREVKFKNVSPAVVVREIRGLEGEDWVANLQFEAENTSGRPLYYISAKLRFPGIVWEETGHNLGFGISQGDGNLSDLRKKAAADARPVMPGETFVLRISEEMATGLHKFFEDRHFTPEQLAEIEFYWDTVSFGDGTGLMSGYLPYPDPAVGPMAFRRSSGILWECRHSAEEL